MPCTRGCAPTHPRDWGPPLSYNNTKMLIIAPCENLCGVSACKHYTSALSGSGANLRKHAVSHGYPREFIQSGGMGGRVTNVMKTEQSTGLKSVSVTKVPTNQVDDNGRPKFRNEMVVSPMPKEKKQSVIAPMQRVRNQSPTRRASRTTAATSPMATTPTKLASPSKGGNPRKRPSSSNAPTSASKKQTSCGPKPPAGTTPKIPPLTLGNVHGSAASRITNQPATASPAVPNQFSIIPQVVVPAWASVNAPTSPNQFSIEGTHRCACSCSHQSSNQ